ncbi:MAG: alpha/beta fold hydrolase [Dechloromonas sp.]|uniref:Alpha/beta fold hydrolase n=1 Tax=Candidatus Dechloromonas phosphorivorans TaxID=2899244 RepID=A0A935K7T5_9RHOO|nr:alpha/beta fold hydrolase [Candidatus Dechloromonas phosphorivorans]
MSTRNVRIHHYPASSASSKPPLLFVHGGYSHSQCWNVRLIPYFQEQGYDCHALDFSGHGDSPGREHLDEFGIDDYVADLAAAVETLTEPPVLIAHSMGCLVSQRYLEQGTARAVAFLAPVPPTGTAGTAARFALTMPDFFAELPKAVNGTASQQTMRTMAKVYFSPDMPARETLEYLPLIQPESEKGRCRNGHGTDALRPPPGKNSGTGHGWFGRSGIPGLNAPFHRRYLASQNRGDSRCRSHADA